MPHLVIRRNGVVENRISFAAELSIGRQGDVVISDARVSRQHARILPVEDGRFVIEKLSAQNLVHLNGQAIEREYLNDHDEIAIGDTMLTFELKALPVPDAAEAGSAGTDVTRRGVKTFEQEDDESHLADTLRGLLIQAKESQVEQQSAVQARKDSETLVVAGGPGSAAPSPREAHPGVAAEGKSGLPIYLIVAGGAILLLIALMALL